MNRGCKNVKGCVGLVRRGAGGRVEKERERRRGEGNGGSTGEMTPQQSSQMGAGGLGQLAGLKVLW